MARLNTKLSATPQLPVHRESTVDSLYREPTPLASHTNRGSVNTYSVLGPSPPNSDKENEQPDSRENTPSVIGAKSRQPVGMGRSQFLTPGSSGESAQHPNKRRRTGDHSRDVSNDIYEDEEEEQEEEEEGEDEAQVDQSQEEEEDGDVGNNEARPGWERRLTRYYDPQQNPEERRKLRANILKHHRQIEDNRDELIMPDNNHIINHIHKQDKLLENVKQTADAALDSRVMLTATDLSKKRMHNMMHGNGGGAIGIEVDQFVGRCIVYMRTGGDPAAVAHSNTQSRRRRRTQTAEDEDPDEDEDSGALDWAFFGRDVTYQFTKRPPVPSFLLGPLSVQRKVRKTQTQRTARSQRQPVGPTTRPQELTQADLQATESSSLTKYVKSINKQLRTHIAAAHQRVEEELQELDDEPDEDDFDAACRRHRVRKTPDDEIAVGLFEFVVNPNSFGQTVENLFYVSFLIKEGVVAVLIGDDELPLLQPLPDLPAQTDKGVERRQKHQAVLSLDWKTWKTLITALDIKEPLIPHRKEEEVGLKGGWYG